MVSLQDQKYSLFCRKHTHVTKTEFFILKKNSHKLENFWWFVHVLSTCYHIRVEIILQRNYNFITRIYKLVVSNKVLIFFTTSQVKWHIVTNFHMRVLQLILWK